MERVDQIALHVTKLAQATGLTPKEPQDTTIDSIDGVTSGWLFPSPQDVAFLLLVRI
jgi:hypothetical protein